MNLCSKHLDQEKTHQSANDFIKKSIISKVKGVTITQEKKKSGELCFILRAIIYDGEFQIIIIQGNNIWIKMIYSKNLHN